jgi:Uma2 family endonuclease
MTQLVSVEEYLHTSFEYDAEYVEGKIVHRSLPQLNHSEMQGNLYSALREECRSRGYKVWPELRIRTRRDPARFRVPCIWVIDPTSLTGEIYTQDRLAKITDGQFTDDQILVDLNRFY